ncbi:MAG: hypothetical protein Q7R32_13375 [Dehalococcoidia bacterium]|nr:hypothetical protein [Dehalococcoidia bacterium]
MEADVQGWPTAVWLSGRHCVVEAVLEVWRIDDEWWRERPASRLYFGLLLDDGRTTTVYHDLISGRWAKQSY